MGGKSIYVGAAVFYKYISRMIFSKLIGRDANLTEDRGIFYYPFDSIEVQLDDPRLFTAGYDGRRYEISDCMFRLDEVKNRRLKFKDKLKGSLDRTDDEHFRQLILRNAIDQVIEEITAKKHKVVHGPTNITLPDRMNAMPVNLAAFDEGLRKYFVSGYQDMMIFADIIGAQGFVVHPTQWEWERDYDVRDKAKSRFFQSFRDLARFYANNGYSFHFLIENLEFNKYPATAEELEECYQSCDKIANEEGLNGKTHICLDLQHMRHSYKILNERGPNKNYRVLSEMPYVEDHIPGFSKAHQHFAGICYNENYQKIPNEPDILTEFLDRQVTQSGNVRQVHIGGNSTIEATHDPIRAQSHEWDLQWYQLNAKRCIREIVSAGFEGMFTLEVHGDWCGLISSSNVINGYLKENGVNL